METGVVTPNSHKNVFFSILLITVLPYKQDYNSVKYNSYHYILHFLENHVKSGLSNKSYINSDLFVLLLDIYG